MAGIYWVGLRTKYHMKSHLDVCVCLLFKIFSLEKVYIMYMSLQVYSCIYFLGFSFVFFSFTFGSLCLSFPVGLDC